MAKPSKKKAARRNADSSRNYTFAAVFLIALVFLGLLVASGVELEQDSIAGKLHEVDRGAVSKEDNTITFVDPDKDCEGYKSTLKCCCDKLQGNEQSGCENLCVSEGYVTGTAHCTGGCSGFYQGSLFGCQQKCYCECSGKIIGDNVLW